MLFWSVLVQILLAAAPAVLIAGTSTSHLVGVRARRTTTALVTWLLATLVWQGLEHRLWVLVSLTLATFVTFGVHLIRTAPRVHTTA